MTFTITHYIFTITQIPTKIAETDVHLEILGNFER